ncbi:MAG TPA: 4-hydroxy-tetrahydrodipicolinate reductase [Gammaproteobacteria bacterium]
MSKLIRLAVLGATGRMGRAVIATALDDPRFEIVAAYSRERTGEDAGAIAGRQACGVGISDELEPVVAAGDVAIDFTRPEFMQAVTQACVTSGRALVSGTTGMDDSARAALENAARKIPVFWAPNMSIGVNLLLAALADVASRIGDDYDAEIVEAHHRHKVDAPSGTALALGEVLAVARGKPLTEISDFAREGRREVRETGRIGFHSIRAGEIVGEHDVRLVSAGEEIRLGHSAFSRDAFAAGALRAAVWLQGREPGLYGMRELLDLSAK